MLTKLEQLVIEWAKAKGIFDNSNPIAQAHKFVEESDELVEEILLDDREAIANELGDVLVTLIIQAKMQNLDLTTCLRKAYEKISKRSGRMEGGFFVKDN